MNKKIKKEDLIGDVLNKFPETTMVFLEFGLHCVGCFVSEFETIEQGAKAHGKTKEEIETLIKQLNQILE